MLTRVDMIRWKIWTVLSWDSVPSGAGVAGRAPVSAQMWASHIHFCAVPGRRFGLINLGSGFQDDGADLETTPIMKSRRKR